MTKSEIEFAERQREKLVDLLSYFADGYAVENRHIVGEQKVCEIADHLIANGVTVQEWIPVSERLPENRDDVLICRKWWNEIQKPQIGWYNIVSGEWFIMKEDRWSACRNVTHCMPLPQPPKGE